MNAIILAAGLGSRLKDLTKNKHKALFEIFDIPNIERTILFLKQKGVDEIFIVVGYLAQDFEYLKEKYNVKLIYNKYYKTYSNLYSFLLCKDYFGDSYVIDADVVIFENIFQLHSKSTYYTIVRSNRVKKEWCIVVDNEKVVGVDICSDERPSLLGISYFNKKDSDKIKQKLESVDENMLKNLNLYWDNIVVDMLSDIEMMYINIDKNIVSELDDEEDLKEILSRKEKLCKK
ncbi:hypothetical protein BB381_03805 [Campylobacter pinnipediorum subsp. caledonicus]|uniref:NTP transferase domain-containing protein n=1 Tax=Campylobacter pinnipediorum TaxID=1965231 RepID=UPI0009957D17|nr:NTP transferase domain-containing protein [Campylobacter pinnipediorum]OPA71626.1 hypothetical protein BB381_03805 [Campylobacter pinnipediorum subsp. caledonicus]